MHAHSSVALQPDHATHTRYGIASLHIPGFSSWVREQLEPAQPDIAIIADDRIYCCSQPLLRQGCLPGMPLQLARNRFPYASFYPHDPQLDSATWEDVLHLLHSIAPNLTALRPGWAFMIPGDISGLERLAGSLHASVGIARTPMVAMLAALDSPPGTLRRVEPASGTSFLRDVPLHHLVTLGFARESIERLQLLDIMTPGDAAGLTRRELHAHLGEDGLRLFDILHLERSSYDVPPFDPPPSISAEYQFAHSARTYTELQHAVEDLLCRLVTELGGRQTQLLTIRLAGRHHVRERVIRRVLKSPTADLVQLRSICEMLLLRMISPDEVISTVAIDLGALIVPGEEVATTAEAPLLHETINVISRPFPGRMLRVVLGGAIR
jgi:hypothetical protein